MVSVSIAREASIFPSVAMSRPSRKNGEAIEGRVESLETADSTLQALGSFTVFIFVFWFGFGLGLVTG